MSHGLVSAEICPLSRRCVGRCCGVWRHCRGADHAARLLEAVAPAYGIGFRQKRIPRYSYKRKKTVRPNSAARRKFSAARKKFSAARSFFSAARSFEEVGSRASKGSTSSGWPCRCSVAKCGFGRPACRSGAARRRATSRPMRLRAGFFRCGGSWRCGAKAVPVPVGPLPPRPHPPKRGGLSLRRVYSRSARIRLWPLPAKRTRKYNFLVMRKTFTKIIFLITCLSVY